MQRNFSQLQGDFDRYCDEISGKSVMTLASEIPTIIAFMRDLMDAANQEIQMLKGEKAT